MKQDDLTNPLAAATTNLRALCESKFGTKDPSPEEIEVAITELMSSTESFEMMVAYYQLKALALQALSDYTK